MSVDGEGEQPKTTDVSKLSLKRDADGVPRVPRVIDHSPATRQVEEAAMDVVKHLKGMPVVVDEMRKAMGGVGGLKNMMKAVDGASGIKDAMTAAGLDMDGMSATSRAMKEMTERLAIYDVVQDQLKMEGSAVGEALRVMNGTGFKGTMKALAKSLNPQMAGIGGQAEALAKALSPQMSGFSAQAAALANSINGSGLQDRMQALTMGIGEASKLSHAAASIASQQAALDALDRVDTYRHPPISSIAQFPVIKNPLFETNERLARIESRFEQLGDIAKASAQTGTLLQGAAAEFLQEFKAASKQNDESAAKAIQVGEQAAMFAKQAVWMAVVIPVLLFGLQLLVTYIQPDTRTEDLQQSVTALHAEIEGLRVDQAQAAQDLIEAIGQADQATAAAVLEALQALAADEVVDDTVKPDTAATGQTGAN